MKIILIKDVEKLGKSGEIVQVKPGFARNFLIPKGLAKFSTPELEAQVASKKAEKEKQKLSEKEKVEATAKKLEGAEIIISAKVGKGKKLFGSVTSEQIKEKIAELYKIDLDKDAEFSPKTIKEIGKQKISIKLGKGVSVQLTVSVKGKN